MHPVLVNGSAVTIPATCTSMPALCAGSSAADLSFIPEGAIDHVEVLLDGAAAQYGTDAISGVVTSSSRRNPRRFGFGTVGDYYSAATTARQGRRHLRRVLQYGPAPVRQGFVNFTVEKSFSNFTQYAVATIATSTPKAIRWRSRLSPASARTVSPIFRLAMAFPIASCDRDRLSAFQRYRWQPRSS